MPTLSMETLLFLIVLIVMVLASIVTIVWLIVSAQRENQASGIPPWQFGLRTMLIATTLVALVAGMLAYGMRS